MWSFSYSVSSAISMVVQSGASPRTVSFNYTPRCSSRVGDNVREGVALNGFAAFRRDQSLDLARRHRGRRRRASHVVNLLFLHGAVEVVGAEPQTRLGDFDPRRNPERFDV